MNTTDNPDGLNREIRRLLSRSRISVGVSNFSEVLCRLIPITICLGAAIFLLQAVSEPFHRNVPIVVVALAVLGLAAVVIGTLWGTSVKRVAIRLDQEMGLRDRIASALEFASLDRPTLFMRCQVAEAGRYIGAMDRLPVLPVRRPRALKSALIAVLAIALTWNSSDQLRSLLFPAPDSGYTLPDKIAGAEQKLIEFSTQLAPEDSELFEKIALPAFRELARRGLLNPRPPVARKVPGAPGKAKAKKGVNLPEMPPVEGRFDALPGGELMDGDMIGSTATARELIPAQIMDIFTQAAAPMLNQQSMMSRLGKLDKLSGMSGALKDVQRTFLPMLAAPKEPKPLQRWEEEMDAAMLRSYAEYLNLFTSAMAEKWAHEAEKLDLEDDSGKKGKPGIRFDIPDALKKDLKAEDISGEDLAGAKSRFEDMDLPFSHPNLDKLKLFYSNRPPKGQGPTFAMESTKGAGTQAGAEGAGSGPSSQQMQVDAAPATPLDEAETQAEYEPLEGRMGRGQATVQVLEEIGQYRFKDRTLDRYDDLFGEYSLHAEQTLSEEPIPAEIKRFVKNYFEAIRPGSGEAEEGIVKEEGP